MYRLFAATVLCVVCSALTTSAQEGTPLGKTIDLGPLAEYFTLLSGEASWGVYDSGAFTNGYTVTLKLQAKKDSDTADLYFRAGVFDKGKLLLEAAPLRFPETFTLLKGESTYAYCVFLKIGKQEEGLPWHMMYIRAAKRPTEAK